MLTDFKLLTEEGNLAFYQSAEVTTIYLREPKTGEIINVYTLVRFEECSVPNVDPKPIYLLKNFYKKYQVGIIQYYQSIPSISQKFEQLLNENSWGYGDKNITIEKQFAHINKTFILPSEFSPVCRILKNNFNNGCYILEFFDEKKDVLSFLMDKRHRKYLEQLSTAVLLHIPIELSVIRDRIGNIVFQFPITLIAVKERALSTWKGVSLKLEYHSKLLKHPPLQLLKGIQFDRTIPSFATDIRTSGGMKPVEMNDNSGMNYTFIYNPTNQLILHYHQGAFVKNIFTQGSVMREEPRIFGDQKEEIRLSSPAWGKTKNEINSSSWVRDRIYEHEREELEKGLLFKQYAARHFKNIEEITNEKNKALGDLRLLIQRYGKKGVYISDPYLSADDIINTLYYSEVSRIPLRAIGSAKVFEKFYRDPKAKYSLLERMLFQLGLKDKPKESQYTRKERWLADTRHRFVTSGNNADLNLEFRFVCEGHGWNFHDRFILFPEVEGSKPKVWSLGISVNQFGAEHHILQEIKNAQNIMDAFEDLWNSLEHPVCIAYKSK